MPHGPSGGGAKPIRLIWADAAAGETLISAVRPARKFTFRPGGAVAVRRKIGRGNLGTDAGATQLWRRPTPLRAVCRGVHRLRIFDTVAARDFLERAAGADPNHALTHWRSPSLSSPPVTTCGRCGRRKELRSVEGSPREARLFVEGRYYETINSWEKAGDIYHSLHILPDNSTVVCVSSRPRLTPATEAPRQSTHGACPGWRWTTRAWR